MRDLPEDEEKLAASDDAWTSATDELSEDEGDNSDAPCVDHRTDEDEMPSYTNKQLHGAKVLGWGSSSEAPSLD